MSAPSPQQTVPAGILVRQPPVISAWWYTESPFSYMSVVTNAIGDQFSIVFVFGAWSILDRHLKGGFHQVADEYHIHHREHPRQKIIFAAADNDEKTLLDHFGIPNEVLNHNAFYVDISTFQIASHEKSYDVLYNAQLQRYKRHELMEKITSACIIFGSVDKDYARELPRSFHNFYFPNGNPFENPAKDYKRLSGTEVSELCNHCCVGLCLSGVEGAMLASTEYLLCGLPVVSTRSVGGRDRFFDSRHVLIVDPTPDAVLDAVRELKAREINPFEIRASVIKKIFSERLKLYTMILDMCSDQGIHLDETNLANDIFVNQGFPWKRYSEINLRKEFSQA